MSANSNQPRYNVDIPRKGASLTIKSQGKKTFYGMINYRLHHRSHHCKKQQPDLYRELAQRAYCVELIVWRWRVYEMNG